MSMLDSIRACMELEVPYELPVFALSEQFDARYAELEYSEYIQDAHTVIETQLIVQERFGWDWFWVHLDDTLEFEPLGAGVRRPPDGLPVIVRPLPMNSDTLADLKLPNPLQDGRLPVLIDAIAGLREARGEQVCVTGRAMAPLSAVFHMFGTRTVLAALEEDDDLLIDALKFAEELTTAIGLAQIEAGAHAIWLADLHASSRFISARQYEKFAVEPCRRAITELKKAGAFVFMATGEEDIESLTVQALAEPSAMNLVPEVDVAEVKRKLSKIAIMGNVDPLNMLQIGSASQVAGNMDRLVRIAADGGMIINTGGAILQDAKSPNLHTMVDTAKKIWDIAHARS